MEPERLPSKPVGPDAGIGGGLRYIHEAPWSHPRLAHAAGSIDPDALSRLALAGAWIARVKTLSGRYHTVIVDGMREEIVSVRDPWGLTGPGSGSGTEATIRLDDPLEHWRFGIHQAIIPIGRKA